MGGAKLEELARDDLCTGPRYMQVRAVKCCKITQFQEYKGQECKRLWNPPT